MNRPTLWGACLLATVLSAAAPVAPSAVAATLHLTGPNGAAVTLDGALLGTLPLDGPLEIATGKHEFSATLTGAHPIEQGLAVRNDDEVIHLQLRFLPLSRTSAVASSLLLAGSGQRYVDRPKLGNALTGLEILGLLTALMSELQVQNFRDDYEIALDSYDNAVSYDEIVRWRSAAETSHGDMTSAADRRDLGLALAAGAVVVSALDAWFRFPALEAGVDLSTVGPDAHALAPAGLAPRARIALTLNF